MCRYFSVYFNLTVTSIPDLPVTALAKAATPNAHVTKFNPGIKPDPNFAAMAFYTTWTAAFLATKLKPVPTAPGIPIISFDTLTV